MANKLSIRRVKIQTLNEFGDPEGEPTFGVVASDDYDMAWNDTFESFAELNSAIQEEGSILEIVDWCDKFDELDPKKIGTDNYFGAYNEVERDDP